MKTTIPKSEMAARYRLFAGLVHSREDCTVEYTDGLALDAMIGDSLRRAYVRLLREAPRGLLAVEDVASAFGSPESLREGLAVLRLPEACVRLFELRLEGWTRPAEVEPSEALPAMLMAADNIYTSPAPGAPRAVLGPDGRSVYLHPMTSRAVTLARGVLDPGPERFTLDEAALTPLFQSIDLDLP